MKQFELVNGNNNYKIKKRRGRNVSNNNTKLYCGAELNIVSCSWKRRGVAADADGAIVDLQGLLNYAVPGLFGSELPVQNWGGINTAGGDFS